MFVPYALLAAELERWRSLSWHTLVARVGTPPIATSEMIDGEIVEIEVGVRWADKHQIGLRVVAIAYGPSHWNLERFEETIFIKAPEDDVPSTVGGDDRELR